MDEILGNPTLRAKAKSVAIGELVLNKKINSKQIITAAKNASPVNRANIVEGIQTAAEKDPAFADKELFTFLCKCLEDETDRVKWEAARASSHIIPLLPSLSDKALNGLLINTEHKGMVVRWSAAKALAAIYVHHPASRKDLHPVIEAILLRETDNAIRKIYRRALRATT